MEKPSTSASTGPSVLSTKHKSDEDDDNDERVDAKYAAVPKGANLRPEVGRDGATLRRHEKDYFTGKVRHRTMFDEMWDNMSKKKLKEHAKRRRLTKPVPHKNKSNRTCTVEGKGFGTEGVYETDFRRLTERKRRRRCWQLLGYYFDGYGCQLESVIGAIHEQWCHRPRRNAWAPGH
ncbi:hypothetical protein DL769_008602 [Monosporascus sp. CRB-8-3]|nr:hypothetical protein DL769_008602 [Monosporascus sp. CRB-8-3]